MALARQTEPEREADQGPEHPTVLANRAEKAEIEEEKTAVLAEAIAHQHQVEKGAKTVIVIIESTVKIVRKGVEDLQAKLARLPQPLQWRLRIPLSLDTPHTAGRTATASRGSRNSILSSQNIMLPTARATNFFIRQC